MHIEDIQLCLGRTKFLLVLLCVQASRSWQALPFNTKISQHPWVESLQLLLQDHSYSWPCQLKTTLNQKNRHISFLWTWGTFSRMMGPIFMGGLEYGILVYWSNLYLWDEHCNLNFRILVWWPYPCIAMTTTFCVQKNIICSSKNHYFTKAFRLFVHTNTVMWQLKEPDTQGTIAYIKKILHFQIDA